MKQLLKSSKLGEKLFQAILLCTIGYYAVLPLRNANIRHIFVLCGTLLLSVVMIRRLILNKWDKRRLFALFIFLSMMVFEMIDSAVSIDLKFIYSCLDFSALFIIILTDNDFPVSRKILDWIYTANIITALIMFLISITPTAYLFEDGRYTGALALEMTNPNFTAMMLLCQFQLLVSQYKRRKHIFLLLMILLGLLYLIWLTECRSAIAVALLVLIYILFFDNIKFNKVIIGVVLLIPLLFAPLYLWLFENHKDLTIIGDKPFFSGREIIFHDIATRYQADMKLFLLGDLYAVQFNNAHNAPLTLFASLGLIGLLICYFVFGKRLMKLNDTADTVISRVAVICICGIYILSSTEGLLFTGIFPGISYMYIYYMLAASDKYDDKKSGNIYSPKNNFSPRYSHKLVRIARC